MIWCGAALLSTSEAGWLGVSLFSQSSDSWLEGNPNETRRQKILLAGLFWATTWKERNIIIFENADFSPQRLNSSFIHSLGSWASLLLNLDTMLIRNLIVVL